MLTLPEIQADVERLAGIIGASDSDLPTYGYSMDFARPHIEVDATGYHYVVVERGEEWERTVFKHLDALLEEIFRHVAFSLATKYELAHRVERQDCRRLIFERELELLSTLSSEWANRERQRIAELLQKYPFNDDTGARAH